MKLVGRITSNPFIFAFFMLVALVLGGRPNRGVYPRLRHGGSGYPRGTHKSLHHETANKSQDKAGRKNNNV